MASNSSMGSIVAPHIEFSELDEETATMIRFCRVGLGVYSLVEFVAGVAFMVALQAYWASDLCSQYAAYSTSNSILCEIGMPLFVFACAGIGLLVIMSLLGLYGALAVRRLFISVYLSLSLGLVLFLAFTLTLVVAMRITFVPFGLVPALFLVFSFVPVVTSVLLLRYKSVDKDDRRVRPSPSMLETVLTFPQAPASEDQPPQAFAELGLAPMRGSSYDAPTNDSILFGTLHSNSGHNPLPERRGSPVGSQAAARESPFGGSSGSHERRQTEKRSVTTPAARSKGDEDFMSFL